MNRTVKAVLTVSIVINMLLGGMQLGYLSHCLVTQREPNVEAQLAKFTPEKRALFNSIMGPATQEMDREHSRIDEAKANALAVLMADPFSHDAYLAQVQRIDEMHDRMKLEMAEAVATLARQLNPEERRILAEIISHPPFTLPPGALMQNPPQSQAQ